MEYTEDRSSNFTLLTLKVARMNCAFLRILGVMATYLFLSIIQVQQHSFVIRLLLALAMGIILAGALNFAHECLHLTLIKNRKACRWLGNCSAGLILLNFTLYKEYHLKHHKYVGTDKDTESNSKCKTIFQYMHQLMGLPFARKKVWESFAVIFGKHPYYLDTPRKIHEAKLDGLYLIFFLFLVLFFTVLYPSNMLFCYWVPLFFSYSCILFFGLPEHYGCDPVPNLYSESRTMRSNFLIRFFLWNANFHAEHHLYPGIAGDHLMEVSNREKNHIFYRDSSYIMWHLAVIKNLLRNKT